MKLIRQALDSDIPGIVQVHLSSFQNFFLTFLGGRFLGLLYHEILKEPGHVCLVAVSTDDKIVGFAFGIKNQVGLYKRLAKKRWFAFALASSGAAFRRPSIIPRLLRALRYDGKVREASSPASLMSIAVAPEEKGKGIGKSLVKRFLNEMALKGVETVCLTTDRDNNEDTNIFYQKIGFLKAREFKTPEGRWMYEYTINLSAEKELET
jgi:ribosomal protein S18 acetylase RimI-like enzyme